MTKVELEVENTALKQKLEALQAEYKHYQQACTELWSTYDSLSLFEKIILAIKKSKIM